MEIISKLSNNVYVLHSMDVFALSLDFGIIARDFTANKLKSEKAKLSCDKVLKIELQDNSYSENYGQTVASFYPSHNPYCDNDLAKYEEIYNKCKMKNIKSLIIKYELIDTTF